MCNIYCTLNITKPYVRDNWKCHLDESEGAATQYQLNLMWFSGKIYITCFLTFSLMVTSTNYKINLCNTDKRLA